MQVVLRLLALLGLVGLSQGMRVRSKASRAPVPATGSGASSHDGVQAFVNMALPGSVKHSYSDNEYMVHFPESQQDSCHAILFGVGTHMSVGDYGNMSTALVQKGFVVVIIDPERGSLSKLDSHRSKAAFEFAKRTLPSWVSTCGRFDKWIMGGHSAGGGTIHAVVAHNPSLADAMFSMDPFDIANNGESEIIDTPALFWGFDFTGCFVSKENAAAMAFANTAHTRRVLVRVQKEMILNFCGYSPKYYHCSVADSGCTGCGNCESTPPEFYRDVANSVDQFVVDAFASSWDPQVLNMKMDVPVEVFAG